MVFTAVRDGQQCLYFIEADSPARYLSLPPPFCDTDRCLIVVNSFNGLLCLQPSSKQFDKKYNWMVLNPSTGKVSIDISISRSIGTHSNRTLIKLCNGFGYDGLNDDYKLVVVEYYKYDWDKGSRKVRIYSMKAKSWRCVENKNDCDPERSVRNLSTNGVLIHNNLLHWVVNYRPENKPSISCFNLEKEQWTADVAVPNLDMGSNYVAGLWVFDGCLCLSVNNRFDKFKGWIMKEYGIQESWTKFCFDVPFHFCHRPLSVNVKGTTEQILLTKITCRKGGVNETYEWYNIREKTSKKFEITGAPEHLVSKSMCLRSLVNDFGDCQTTKCNATQEERMKMKIDNEIKILPGNMEQLINQSWLYPSESK